MIILDTSIWIEFLRGNEKYYSIVKDLLENQKVLAAECIFGELLQGSLSKREQNIIVQYWNNLPKCSIDEIWIQAGKYSAENKLHSRGIGLIDCIIIVSAKNHNAKILSLDNKLNSILTKDEIFAL